MIKKIISGGQTGVDRAALDAARLCGVRYGGSVPRGRKAEDGSISLEYQGLTELSSPSYEVRTEKNVKDGDATIVFTVGLPTGGTEYTINCAEKCQRPYLLIDLNEVSEKEALKKIILWLREIKPSVLNVAGPRESKEPGIYTKVIIILRNILQFGVLNKE